MKDKRIGLIGAGQMGGGICENLLKAGFRLKVHDRDEQAMERALRNGARPAGSGEELIGSVDVVLTCLPGEIAKRVVADLLIPNARAGQVFVDHSTVSAPFARKVKAELSKKGAEFLDAPISGGTGGANAGTLSIFVGGDRDLFERCLPLFEAAGNPERVFYAGESGRGQVYKMIQQLRERSLALAGMEVLAAAVREGMDLATALAVMGISPEDRGNTYVRLVNLIESGRSGHISTMFAEWDYFLEETAERGIPMPVLEAMQAFCEGVEPTARDNVNRPQVDIWEELLKRKGPAFPGVKASKEVI